MGLSTGQKKCQAADVALAEWGLRSPAVDGRKLILPRLSPVHQIGGPAPAAEIPNWYHEISKFPERSASTKSIWRATGWAEPLVVFKRHPSRKNGDPNTSGR